MSQLHIHRDHELGLTRAQAVCDRWVAEARSKFGMTCVVARDPSGDSVDFRRAGVNGVLRVTADRFALDVALGFLLSAFSDKIRSEIEANLDNLLASAGAQAQTMGGRPQRQARRSGKDTPT